MKLCGNNHWILCQTWPGQYKIYPWPVGPLPPQTSNKQIEEPQTAVSPLLGFVSGAYWR